MIPGLVQLIKTALAKYAVNALRRGIGKPATRGGAFLLFIVSLGKFPRSPRSTWKKSLAFAVGFGALLLAASLLLGVDFSALMDLASLTAAT